MGRRRGGPFLNGFFLEVRQGPLPLSGLGLRETFDDERSERRLNGASNAQGGVSVHSVDDVVPKIYVVVDCILSVEDAAIRWLVDKL